MMTPAPGSCAVKGLARTGGRFVTEGDQCTTTNRNREPTARYTRITHTFGWHAQSAATLTVLMPPHPVEKFHMTRRLRARWADVGVRSQRSLTLTATALSAVRRNRPGESVSTVARGAHIVAQPLGDARPVQSYHVTLWNVDRTMTAIARIIVRESDAEAIDSAKRWLRLVRRSNAGLPRLPDRWTVSVKGKTSLPQIIASGGANDL